MGLEPRNPIHRAGHGQPWIYSLHSLRKVDGSQRRRVALMSTGQETTVGLHRFKSFHFNNFNSHRLVLRALAEGRIKWGFYPPDMDVSTLAENDKGLGIWLGEGTDDYTAELTGSDYAADSDDSVSVSEEDGSTPEDEEPSTSQAHTSISVGTGMFSALSLEEDGSS